MIYEEYSPSALAISIVSHGQGALIRKLLQDLQPLAQQGAQILLTLNLPEEESFVEGLTYGLTVIRNAMPKGFGDNHNSACGCTSRPWFAVLNPDIRCSPSVFAALAAAHREGRAGVTAPRVVSPDGQEEDSVRRYPSVLRIAARVAGRLAGLRMSADYALGDGRTRPVDWAAGMFLLFKTTEYRHIGGFDPRYFLYLEDADICRRLHSIGRPALVVPSVSVVHDARRATGRSLRHLRWHLASMVRFLFITRWSRPPRPLAPPTPRL